MSGRMTIGLDAGYIQMWDNAMRQNSISPYVLQVLNFQPYLKGHFTNWFSADYRLAYSKNTMDIEDATSSNYDALKQYLTLNLYRQRSGNFPSEENIITQCSLREVLQILYYWMPPSVGMFQRRSISALRQQTSSTNESTDTQVTDYLAKQNICIACEVGVLWQVFK